MNSQPLDATRIGVQNLELYAALVRDELAFDWNAPQMRHDEAADGIDLALVVRLQQLHSEMRLELVDWRARLRDQARPRILGDIGGLLDIIFVLDVTDHLLDEILDGRKAVRPAVLVDDERNVIARRLHPNEQVHGRHGRRNVEHRS